MILVYFLTFCVKFIQICNDNLEVDSLKWL